MPLPARIVIRVLLCALASWGVVRVIGLIGLAVTAPLYAVALARPLIDLASWLRHEMRRANWAPVEGRYYAFRGVPVRVRDDADRQRWVHLGDVRRIVGHTSGDATLQVAYAAGFKRFDGDAHLSDEALLKHLGKETRPEALKLRQWVEREIVFPARRERADAQRRMRSTSDVVE